MITIMVRRDCILYFLFSIRRANGFNIKIIFSDCTENRKKLNLILAYHIFFFNTNNNYALSKIFPINDLE